MLARELHDVVTHQLSTVSLQVMSHLDSDDAVDLAQVLRRVDAATSSALTELRLLVRVLRERPGTGKRLGRAGGAVPAPRADRGRRAWSARLADAGFDPVVEVPARADQLEMTVQATLVRTLDVACGNILRHAPPGSACTVALAVHPTQVVIRVISPLPVGPHEPVALGRSLRGLRERVDLIGGGLRAGPASAAGSGPAVGRGGHAAARLSSGRAGYPPTALGSSPVAGMPRSRQGHIASGEPGLTPLAERRRPSTEQRIADGLRAVPLTVTVFLVLDTISTLVGQAYGITDLGPTGLRPAGQMLLVVLAAAATMYHRPRVAVVLTALVVLLVLTAGPTGEEDWLLLIVGVTSGARAGRRQLALLALAGVAYATLFGLQAEERHPGWGWAAGLITLALIGAALAAGLVARRFLRARDRRRLRVEKLEREQTEIRAVERARLADELQAVVTQGLATIEARARGDGPRGRRPRPPAPGARAGRPAQPVPAERAADPARRPAPGSRTRSRRAGCPGHLGAAPVGRPAHGAARPLRCGTRCSACSPCRPRWTASPRPRTPTGGSRSSRCWRALSRSGARRWGPAPRRWPCWGPSCCPRRGTGTPSRRRCSASSPPSAPGRGGPGWSCSALAGYGGLLAVTESPTDVGHVVVVGYAGFAAVALGLTVRHFVEARAESLRRLVDLTEEREQVELEERTAVARELHDVVAHQLSVTTMLVMATSLSNDPVTLADTAAKVRRSTEAAHHELSTLLHAMRGPAAPQPGPASLVTPLTSAHALVRRLSENGYHPVLDVDPAADELDTTTQRTLARIIQEAATNILRYTPTGSTCHFTLTVDSQEVRLRIDSPLAAQAQTSDLSLGWGLRGIRERVELTHGTFAAGPAGGSWRLEVTLPAPVDTTRQLIAQSKDLRSPTASRA